MPALIMAKRTCGWAKPLPALAVQPKPSSPPENQPAVIRELDRLRIKGSLQKGVKTEAEGTIRIMADSPDTKSPVLNGNVIDEWKVGCRVILTYK